MNILSGEPQQQQSKLDAMDSFFQDGEKLTGSEVTAIVNKLYTIDLNQMPLLPQGSQANESHNAGTAPIEAMDAYISRAVSPLSGPDARSMINQLFGINLDALSALEGCRISLFSKGRWMLRQKTDLFEVHTGEADWDVAIYAAPYFTEQTGLHTPPPELQAALLPLGYGMHTENNSLYYRNSEDSAVPDSFKGKTMQALISVIRQHYSPL